MPESPLYRDFYYPLNVLLHVLTLEEGEVRHLHYGLFEQPDEPIGTAQERASSRILSELPPPPARILDVGSGLGSNLNRLVEMGYDALGITPDVHQIGMIRARYGDALPLECVRFEDLPDGSYDVAMFHESSQYIDSEALFAKAAEMAPRVIVLDEFALRDEGTLHRLDAFLAAAARFGFSVTERVDLSAKAPPTIDYFIARLPRYRTALIEDLGLTNEQVDELIVNGEKYAAAYRRGVYGYLLLQFQR